MRRLKILTLICSLLLSFSLLADDDDYKHEHKKSHIYKNLDYLNLSKHQHKEIKEIVVEYREKYEKFYKKREEKEKRLQELLREETFDKERYEQISKKIHEDAIELEIETLQNIHSVLSTSQRERFSYYLREWQVE
jgi:Spy/CpxP family protein refolding chaperone